MNRAKQTDSQRASRGSKSLHLLSFAPALLLLGVILAAVSGSELEIPISREESVTLFDERWHWIAAWAGVWLLVSAGLQRTLSNPTAIAFSGLAALSLGVGACIFLLAGLIEVSEWTSWIAILIALWGGWLIFQIARLASVWSRLQPELAKRKPGREGKALWIGFREHFIYLAGTLATLVVVGSVILWPALALSERAATGLQFWPSLLLATLAASAFGPLLIAYWLRAKEESGGHRNRFWRTDVVSPAGLVFIVVTVGGVSLLAYYAALYATEGISAAISYATFIGVFCLFILVIAAPHIRAFFHRRSEETIATPKSPSSSGTPVSLGVASLEGPARLISCADTLLVKVVAPLSGATQTSFAHAHVIATLSLLSLLGLVIPRPFGLVPILIGVLLAIALGRRWAWVEEDRETASRLQRTDGATIHLGFENDLKDEALLAYTGLFILVPLTLYQVQDITHFTPQLQEQPGILLTWIVFFGGELAKAVPFVDWWDIYGNNDLEPIGKHLTFVSRAAVDLVILAALFQALGIWQRGRVQSRLYADGHLDAFDPFKERDFFEQGIVKLEGERVQAGMTGAPLARAQKFEKRLEALRKARRLVIDQPRGGNRTYYMVRESFEEQVVGHQKNQDKLLSDRPANFEAALPYSRRRLGELLNSPNQDLRAGARWMVERWKVLVGNPPERLNQLSRQWAHDNFPTRLTGDPAAASRLKRIQKMEFEKILVELSEALWVNQLRKQDVSDLMQCLRRVRQDDEFDFARILAFELFGHLKSVNAVLFLSKFVLRQEELDRWEDWRARMIAYAEGADCVMRLGRSEMRQRVYDAAARIACSARAGDSARLDATILLEFLATEDPAQDARQHAQHRAREAREAIEQADLFSD